jgi:fibro-slime domain-containing protein
MIILALALCASAGAQNYELYVLPPGDESWILGTPYLKVVGKDPERLQMDTTCGWFKKVYPIGEQPPESDAWIWLGAKKTEQVGVKGMTEDPVNWPDENPTPFKLNELFDSLASNKIYFFANEGRWRATPPTPSEKATYESRCSYKFAAIIYERSSYSNTDGFSWYGASLGSGTDTRTFGICKGVVKETLGEDGKMQFNGEDCKNDERYYAANPNGSNWVNEENFKNAFKETPGQNVEKCWDMPFRKMPNGLWEFDAYYLCKDGVQNNDPYTDPNSTTNRGCNDGRGNIGGFYPGFGARENFTGQLVDIKETHKWCFDRGWSGQGGPGDLSDKYTRDELDAEMKRVCGSSSKPYPIASTDAGLVNGQVDAHNPNWTGPNVARGGHICFESQDAEFTYEPGQEFFFRGDDDIWVFINNRLVVDLGGTHMPAPGYVKLDTIGENVPANKLKEGDKYPIKIFFCDRRGPGSNVRISTNMYFSQKNGLTLKKGTAAIQSDVCLQTSGGGSCDAIGGVAGSEAEICGKDLAKLGRLNYYITRIDGVTDRMELTDTTSLCTMESGELKCFQSVTINFEDGNVWILPVAQGLVGTWVVWVEVKGMDGVPPKKLGTTTGRTAVQVVWGNVIDSNSQTIVKIPFKKDVGGKIGMEAVASKLIPIGFAEGAWRQRDSSVTDATFEVNMKESPGKTLRLQPSSFRDTTVGGSYLKVYRDSLGTDPVINLYEEFKIPEDGPNKGVLLLYFTGTFEANGTAIYDINSNTTKDPFALKVHQPKIEFIDTNTMVTSNSIIPQSQRFGSDPTKLGTAKDKWVFVGNTVSRKIAAFDPTVSPMTVCTTCTFDQGVRTEPWVRTKGTDKRADGFIQFPASDNKLENGIGSLSLFSTEKVQIEDDEVGFFTISGPSPDTSTIARWDSLQFREPPVPYPVHAEIFDRNGDGKGDSIRIVYNRAFPHDTLPNKVQVIWSLRDTVSFGLAQKNASGQYTNEIGSAKIDTAANRRFWMDENKYLKRGVCPDSVKAKDCSDTIAIAVPYDSAALQFSRDIKTASHSIDEVVLSWSTFMDQGLGTTQSLSLVITDSIPPIIISARYEAKGSGECGTDAGNLCQDVVHIELSEPVERAEGVDDGAINEAFAYKLQARKDENATFEVYREERSLPKAITWAKPSSNRFPVRDSSVRLTYYSYKNETENSYTPFPGDSVRLLDKLNAKPKDHAFRDLVGNAPNPKEWGRRLEGKGRSSVNKNLIAGIDPLSAEDSLKERIRDRFGRQVGSPGYTLAERFNEGPIQWMPVPGSWKGDSLSKELGLIYPGTVGTIFWPEAGANIRYLESETGYGTIPRENIFFVANSFYHTNLGNYVVKSGELRIACDDPVFKIDGAKDCTDERENGIYLSWDLRDNKGRWVGTGAYVQVYNYYWEIKDTRNKIIEKDGKQVEVNVNGVLDRYPGEGNKIEMFGAVRGAKNN